MADMGQLAKWDFKVERYVPNQQIYNFVVDYLRENGAMVPDPESSQVAYNHCTELFCQYLFRQLAAALVYLHE